MLPHLGPVDNNFLNVGRWQPRTVLQIKASKTLATLAAGKGQLIELIIDDSKKQKQGKTIQAVNWMRYPLSGRNIKGHQYVTATIRDPSYSLG